MPRADATQVPVAPPVGLRPGPDDGADHPSGSAAGSPVGPELLVGPPRPVRADGGMLRHMPQLDGLRAMAVLCVFIQHFWLVAGRHYVPFGRFGVKLFFVLSGFLITGILLRCRDLSGGDGAQSRGFTLRRFYLRRFLRLMPPYYLLLAAAVAVGIPTFRDTVVWHAAYLSNFLFASTGKLNGPAAHFWSLAVEEQFYLVWPFVILFVRARWLVPAILVTIAVGPAYRLAATAMGWGTMAVLLPPFACLDTLGLGALLAVCSQPGDRWPAWRERLCRAGLWIGLPLAVAAAVLHGYKAFGRATDVWNDLALGLFSVWLIGRAATGFGGPARSLLEARPVLYLGKISYGLYLYHLLVPFLVLPVYERATGRKLTNPHAYFAVMSAVSVAVAAASWHLFEAPLGRLKGLIGYRQSDGIARPVRAAEATGPAATRPRPLAARPAIAPPDSVAAAAPVTNAVG